MTLMRSTYLFALASTTSLWSGPRKRSHSRSWVTPGRGSYVRYCGSCHGDDGKANGPKAATLNPKPADLTQLAKKNGGTLPTSRVNGILDGSQAIPAHGTAQQPIWGHVFGAAEHAAGRNPGPQTVAHERIKLILQYLETIQEK